MLLFVGLSAAAVAAIALVVWALATAHARPGTGSGPKFGHAHGQGHRLGLPQRLVLGVLTMLIRASLRAGVRLGPMRMLTLPGRKSGRPRTNPVDVWSGDGPAFEGRTFLVATHTDRAAWVRNLRAAGGGTLALGRRRWSFTAVELSLDEAAGVLEHVLGPRMRRPVAGFVLRRTVAVAPDAPTSEFLTVARTHPVFEIQLVPQPRPAGARNPLRLRPAGGLITVGLLVAATHLVLGLLDVLGLGQWISGVAIGLLIAGLGNHMRIFGRRPVR